MINGIMWYSALITFNVQESTLLSAKMLSTVYFFLFLSVALRFLKNLCLSSRGFRHLVGLLEQEIGPSQSLYLQRTAEHRGARTNSHASSRIRTHDPSIEVVKTHAPDCAGAVIDSRCIYQVIINRLDAGESFLKIW
jgi:hypothetical protein